MSPASAVRVELRTELWLVWDPSRGYWTMQEPSEIPDHEARVLPRGTVVTILWPGPMTSPWPGALHKSLVDQWGTLVGLRDGTVIEFDHADLGCLAGTYVVADDESNLVDVAHPWVRLLDYTVLAGPLLKALTLGRMLGPGRGLEIRVDDIAWIIESDS